MRLQWKDHLLIKGFSIAKYNGYSIIHDKWANVRQYSYISGAKYEVMDRLGAIHHFSTRKAMERFISE